VRDARKTFDLIAGELLRVDLAGYDAWVLAADESALRSAGPCVASGYWWRRICGCSGRTAPSCSLARARMITRRCRTGSTRPDSW
jgi:hypothetical protein